MTPATPPPLKPKSGVHPLTWWSLALTILSVISFVGGFVLASNSPKHADQGWQGDVWMVMIFGIAPLCLLGAAVTGIIGMVKRGGCLAIGTLLVPALVVVFMILFLWLALEAAGRFR